MAVKVGTSRNAGLRERWLNCVNPNTDAQVYSCCGCSDWKVVWKRRAGLEEAALEFDAKFKEAFDLFQVWGDHAPLGTSIASSTETEPRRRGKVNLSFFLKLLISSNSILCCDPLADRQKSDLPPPSGPIGLLLDYAITAISGRRWSEAEPEAEYGGVAVSGAGGR